MLYERLAQRENAISYNDRTLHLLGKENDKLKAEREKNIAAISRLRDMLAEARKSASKPNASQEQ